MRQIFRLVIDQFAPTVKMSTYLVALAVLNEYEQISNVTQKTKYSVEVSGKKLNYLVFSLLL